MYSINIVGRCTITGAQGVDLSLTQPLIGPNNGPIGLALR